MIVNHQISGHNFHGRYGLVLRGPEEGFILSQSQARRLSKALCAFTDCHCGGGYGDGPDKDSARIEQADWDSLRLIPAVRKGSKSDESRAETQNARAAIAEAQGEAA